MAKGNKVADLPTAALVGALGESVEVRKSQVEGKRYPLYLVTPWGPWPINTPAGQEFILENAGFQGAPARAVPASAPGDTLGESVTDPAPAPVPARVAASDAPGENPEKPGENPGGEGMKSFFEMLGKFE